MHPSPMANHADVWMPHEPTPPSAGTHTPNLLLACRQPSSGTWPIGLLPRLPRGESAATTVSAARPTSRSTRRITLAAPKHRSPPHRPTARRTSSVRVSQPVGFDATVWQCAAVTGGQFLDCGQCGDLHLDDPGRGWLGDVWQQHE